jgi:acyl-CoA synthetase (AMP-forming)/AMP-acid ligase II
LASSGAKTLFELISLGETERPAIGAPGDTWLSYGGLSELCARTGHALNAAGLGRNDRIAIVLPNGPKMAAAFIAIGAHATAAPLNPGYKSSEFEFYLTDLNAKAIVLASGFASPARDVASALGVPVIELTGTNDRAGDFTLGIANVPPASPAFPGLARADDIALVLHTSGTTARPKIVPLTQANVTASAAHIVETLRLTSVDTCLNIMPLFHIHGLIAAVLASLSAGGSVVCTPGFEGPRFFDWMKHTRPSWYTAVPSMHQGILKLAPRFKEIVSANKLRFIRSSSSSLPPQVMNELESIFEVPVIEAYGMTEAAHQMASNPLPPKDRFAGIVGLAAGPEIAIMDENGNIAAPGEIGEVVIRGANVMSGYENNPTANASAFTNGWFRTGDEGSIAANGYLRLTGRLKEQINRAGEKISPLEVDNVLMEHPAVQQALTFAIPDRDYGEIVAAAIVLRDGQTADAQAIRHFASTYLAGFKVPAKIIFLDEIPKGATGKLQRIGLAAKLGFVTEGAGA